MTRLRTTLLPSALFAVSLPFAAFAAGTETAPVSTQTTQQCTGGQVWDAATSACVDAQESRLDDDTRLDAARELVAHGRAADALTVLEHVARAETPEVLTLKGFATRRAGDFAAARVLYDAALTLDPEYILARSYLGQGLVEAGDKDGALQQLAMIREMGGRGTWAEVSLATALETGRGYSH